jgi:hypothetical protein
MSEKGKVRRLAAKAPKSMSDTYVVEKTTTNTVRFKIEDGDPKEADLGYVYIKNEAVKKLGNPKKIKITVEAA